MSKSIKASAIYIASLKNLAINHQHCHWQSKGDSFYAHHQLFERLYDGVLKDLDLAAEKFIGVFGAECLDYVQQTELLNKILKKYKLPEFINLY